MKNLNLNVESLHTQKRENSPLNPIILKNGTTIKQPQGVSFSIQKIGNLTQAKVFIKIIERLQEPIRDVIKNKHYRENPDQLNLFQKNENLIQLDFRLSDFGVSNSNYKMLLENIYDMQKLIIKNDVVYFNRIEQKIMEAEARNCLIYKITTPKKYERYISLEITKEVAQILINIDSGYFQYFIEIALKANSKYVLLIYQFISSWKDKGGCSINYKNFRKELGVEDAEYKDWYDFNRRVLEPAYYWLHEKADVWFEYDIEKKDGEVHKINFKIIKGYIKIDNKVLDNKNEDVILTLDFNQLSELEKKSLSILRTTLLIEEPHLLGEIIVNNHEKFTNWWKVNKDKLNEKSNPSGSMLTYLKLTSKCGYTPRKWEIIEFNYKQKWEEVINILKNTIPEEAINNAFKLCSIININNQKRLVTLLVPNNYIRNTLDDIQIKPFNGAFNQVFAGYKLEYSIMQT